MFGADGLKKQRLRLQFMDSLWWWVMGREGRGDFIELWL